ncbi:aminoglycoside phosphotransferase family protein [Kitasatospora sp. NPDC050543]|uniref:aminoglycoside phosphotransferase family protein n=1 Tax=Kitasatospora sp. NPDC050543 TaxID=3364054 RepID=UPI0037AED361
MEQPNGRVVSVHLTHLGDYLGLIGPFDVDVEWWSVVAPVTARLEAELGVPVGVLRLVSVSGGEGGSGGHTVYHAEALARPEAPPPGRAPAGAGPDGAVAALLAPHARRSPWATAPGLRSALDWAALSLHAAGRACEGPAEQVRAWNLSGILKFPTPHGPVWLKATDPAFNTPEGDVIALLRDQDATLVPAVIAADRARGRVLLDHVPGEDCWGPSAEIVDDVVPRLVAAQAALAAADAAAVTGAGLADRTPRALIGRVPALLDGEAGRELTPDELAQAGDLAARLPALVAELESCGLPNTLVHGDFHPGNWRFDGQRTVLVDFADSCYGHPALDGLRPRGFVSGERWKQIADTWTRAWSAHAPGSDPARALALAEPLAHLSYAVRYQEFLAHIEPSERVYHEGDPAAELRAALAAVQEPACD